MENIADILAKNNREMESLDKQIKRLLPDRHQGPFDSILEAVKIANQPLRSITAWNIAEQPSINLSQLFGRHQGQFGLTQEAIKSLLPPTESQKNLQSSMESLGKWLNIGQEISGQLQRQYVPIVAIPKKTMESLRPITAWNIAEQPSINLSQLFGRHQGQFGLTQEAIKSLLPPTESQKNLQSSLEPFRKQQQSFRKIMIEAKLLNNQSPIIFPDIKKIERYSISSSRLTLAIENLQRTYEEGSQSTEEASLLLAEHCWYFDFNMPANMFQKLGETTKEDIAKVELALIKYFEWRCDEIEASLIAQFPHRVDSIRSVFKSHRYENYDASIKQFFALIDGICKEDFGGYLFIRKDGKPETAQYVEQITRGKYMSALSIPLTRITSINKSKRKEDFNQLNRHVIMHGDLYNGATKANSLKALSLINYVSGYAKMWGKHRKTNIGLH